MITAGEAFFVGTGLFEGLFFGKIQLEAKAHRTDTLAKKSNYSPVQDSILEYFSCICDAH